MIVLFYFATLTLTGYEIDVNFNVVVLNISVLGALRLEALALLGFSQVIGKMLKTKILILQKSIVG
jgi:hypothetical protein